MNSTNAKPKSTDPQTSQRIWLEVGHAYEPRYWKSGRAVPEDWRVWVRGAAGADIAALVDKVVFQLCPDTQFPFPKRIFLEAPYQLEEAGSAPAEILIDVHLKCSTKPEKFQLKYGSLFDKAEESSADSRCVFYDVQNPSEQLRASPMKPSAQNSGSVLVLLPDSGEVGPRPDTPQAPKQCLEPADPVLSHKQMLLFESCATCDSSKSSTCPLLHQEPTKRTINDELSFKNKISNKKYGKAMVEESMKPSDYPRRSCHRCLTRATPCESCQPRRIPKLQASSPEPSHQNITLRENDSSHNNLKMKSEKLSDSLRSCRRCLTRVTPCPSCQPRRIPKLQASSPEPSHQKKILAENDSTHTNLKMKSIKLSDSLRSCHRCLTRATPCPSCQPRRVSRLQASSPELSRQNKTLRENDSSHNNLKMKSGKLSDSLPSCRRCLTRVTPCPSCQPRRILKRPLA